MHQKILDLKYGKSKELTLFQFIKNKYGDDIKMNIDPYSVFDYSNNNTQIELKNRRVHFNTYPSLMIGNNKLMKAHIDLKNNKITSIFLWNLLDGLYEWEFNEAQYYLAMGGTFRGGRNEPRICGFIKNIYLTKIR